MGNHYEEEESPEQRLQRERDRENTKQQVLGQVRVWLDDVSKDIGGKSRGKITLSYERLNHGQGVQILLHEESYPARFNIRSGGD